MRAFTSSLVNRLFGIVAISGLALSAGAAGTPTGTSDDKTAENPDATYGTIELDPLNVSSGSYKPFMTKLELMKVNLYFSMTMDLGWPTWGGAFLVTPAHSPQKKSAIAYTARIFDRRELLRPASNTLEGVLLSMPDVSRAERSGLFSQRDGLGIVLRGVGNKDTLVLLDGVPINDPYGGWVPWSAVPRAGIWRVEVVPGGGATAWGNGALGGVIQLFTVPAKGSLSIEQGSPTDGGPPDPKLKKQVISGTGEMSVAVGEHGTIGTDLVASQPTGSGILQVIGQAYYSDGVPVVAPEKRGTIDTDAWSHQSMGEARWRQPLKPGIELTATVREYEDSQGDGSPDQEHSSKGTFTSVALAGNQGPSFAWNGTAYAQTGSSAGSFSAINSDRTDETPLIQEVATPSIALGASWTGVWRTTGNSRTTAGMDFRSARGESREDVGFDNGTFSQELIAGGTQDTTGLFLLREQPLSAHLRATFGARLDAWEETHRHERTIDRATGSDLSNEQMTGKSGAELIPSLGLVWRPDKNWQLHTNAQRSYRRPTLGESYRTFGHQSVISLASPDLRTEYNNSIEAGADYSFYKSSAPEEEGIMRELSRLATLGVSVFANDMHDMIGDVTVPYSTSLFPGLSALPAGYIVRQRINFDRARVQGVRFSADWRPNSLFSVNAGMIFNASSIRRLDAAPDQTGRQLAHVPRQTATLGATWQMAKRVSLAARLRYASRQYDDNENTLRLGMAATLDVGATYEMTKHAEWFITAENVGNARVETSRSSDGIVYLGSVRLIEAGLRTKW